MRKKSLFTTLIVFAICLIANSQDRKSENIILRHYKETITPIELDHGDILKYSRKDGNVLTIELLSTAANILYTNKDKIPVDESGNDKGNMYRARLMYEFICDVKINGLPMRMRRYVGSQESFYEPYVINGVRIWFDGVSDIFQENGGFLNTARSANGKPQKNARFVLHDMTQRICPDPIRPWFLDDEERNDNFIYKENFIDIGRTFNGADCFLGPYLAGESHGALDIDMTMNSLMYAPFDLDNQAGIRVEGKKTWPDGSEWRINTGHIIEKLVPDDVPVKGGTPYGRGARRGCWWHPHAHFGFQVYESEILYDIDTWILFWQNFEDNKIRDRELRAMMIPLDHSKTGEIIQFRSVCNLEVDQCSTIKQYWTFGDGGCSFGASPEYLFSSPGIYPVTLTIKKGNEISSFTQHITIEGHEASKPVLSLSSLIEPSFRVRPVDMMDVYGWPIKNTPHTLKFLARSSRPRPDTQKLQVVNRGKGKLSLVTYDIDYIYGSEWLNIKSEGERNDQELDIGVNGKDLLPGEYVAQVTIESEGALNSLQKFRVVMTIPELPAKSTGIVVDDKDEGFYCTPYFWVGYRFHGWGWPELKDAEGYNNFYLMNGLRDRMGEFARFTPNLEAGTYEIWLYEKTPFASGPPADNEPARFKVHVHSKVDTTIWMEPQRMKGFYPRPYMGEKKWQWLEEQPSRKIGTFKFEEGKDGYVEILADGSTGQVIVDAVRFLKMDY